MIPLYAPDPDWISVLVLAFVVLFTLYSHFSSADTDPYLPEGRRERAREKSFDGAIDEDEFDRILETTEDPEIKHI